MMALVVNYIYPYINLEYGCVINIIDGVETIVAWNDIRPQPSAQDISNATLPALKDNKIKELKDICSSIINSGFVSSALGAPYTYDSALPQDQINLLGAMLKGTSINYTCTDSAGVKAQVMHTHAQIVQVFSDGGAWIESNKARFYARKASVEAAADILSVTSVGW